MTSKNMAAFIDEIRETELASVNSERTEGRLEHILASLDERGTAQTLVQQQLSLSVGMTRRRTRQCHFP